MTIPVSYDHRKKTYCFQNSLVHVLNPLLRNVVKWLDKLQKSCSICCKIFKVCLTILRHCEVKG